MMRLFTVVVAALAWVPAAQASETSVDDVSFDAVDVAFLGEVHDNPDHHAAQAEWVARMAPAALVFEMLTPGLALKVGVDRDDLANLALTLEWEARGWPDFAFYHPIFTAAPEAAVFGGEMPAGKARMAVAHGAASVMGGAAELFGLDAPLPEDQQEARLALQAAAHCDALPDDLLPGMVEAQRLRDASIARAVIAALAETGGPVAVVTGNGHTRLDWGAPALLALLRPDLAVLSIGQFEAPQEAAIPFDLWTVAPAPERDDPCAGFNR